MDISFLILSWNSAHYIEECVRSIFRSLVRSELKFEVLCFDNGSTDGSVDKLRELSTFYQDKFKIFCEATNLGTTVSRNRLVDFSSGEFLCFMDSDAFLEEGVVERMMSVLSSRENIGMVVPRVNFPSGNWQKSIDFFPTLLSKANRVFGLRGIESREALIYCGSKKPIRVDTAISAFWFLRRSVFVSVGKLDERIFYSPEDLDFCIRLYRSGLIILYVPDVSVIHCSQEISRGFRLNRAKFSHAIGLAYYFLKHRYLFRRPVFNVDQ